MTAATGSKQDSACLVAVVVEQPQLGLADQVHALHGADRLCVAQRGDTQHLAVANDGGVAEAALTCKLSMGAQERVLAMHRQEMLRLGEPENLCQLLPGNTSLPSSGSHRQ